MDGFRSTPWPIPGRSLVRTSKMASTEAGKCTRKQRERTHLPNWQSIHPGSEGANGAKEPCPAIMADSALVMRCVARG